jgi:hypothetical protein
MLIDALELLELLPDIGDLIDQIWTYQQERADAARREVVFKTTHLLQEPEQSPGFIR